MIILSARPTMTEPSRTTSDSKTDRSSIRSAKLIRATARTKFGCEFVHTANNPIDRQRVVHSTPGGLVNSTEGHPAKALGALFVFRSQRTEGVCLTSIGRCGDVGEKRQSTTERQSTLFCWGKPGKPPASKRLHNCNVKTSDEFG